ncbi:spore cortex biosynthesis protein YabQ [Tenuibacillus multivorans]|uniref:Spore cortex biosynthesis protein YabQ n=1 Tax=Tenuibacillus multivorans TaxID=237069 RepID=A0A1G9VYK2_9BACI|nr:spore cortex biosynthesis protein YabQ [Tenuibacillus multivorans]GEL78250.1 spore protein YabQ [Tenuibacillus multivorans]SDM77378.1 spore cortex biosynthesis protein YabQ [Tenuibacillus multivorans]
MSLDTQFLTLVTMVASGVVVSALFDTYKLLLRPTPYWNRVIVDTLFFLTQSCLVFYILFLSNGGILRFYLFLAVLLGISTYYAILQSVYTSFLNTFIQIIQSAYQFVKRILNKVLLQPIVRLIQLIIAIIVGILSVIWKILMMIYSVIIFLIRPFIPKFVQNYLLNLLVTCSRIMTRIKKGIRKFWNKRRRKDDEASS